MHLCEFPKIVESTIYDENNLLNVNSCLDTWVLGISGKSGPLIQKTGYSLTNILPLTFNPDSWSETLEWRPTCKYPEKSSTFVKKPDNS